jgi:hypothetical protein
MDTSYNLTGINSAMFIWIMLKLKYWCSRALGMIRNTSRIWRLGIASLTLLAAVAVYCFARIYPPELLTPIQVVNTELAAQTAAFGSAPSFFYTLALGLFIGVCVSNRSSARFHCLIWIGLALFLELSQHPVIAEFVSGYIKTSFPNSIWTLIGPYWSRGVFDPMDLLATVMGGSIAFYLLTHLSSEKADVRYIYK